MKNIQKKVSLKEKSVTKGLMQHLDTYEILLGSYKF